MFIKSVKLKNFRQFSDVEINLNKDEKRPINLIEGVNGSGKTNFYNAILWGLYNEYPFGERLLNNNAEKNLSENDTVQLWAEITFEYNDTEYTLKRILTYTEILSSHGLTVALTDSELTLHYFDKNSKVEVTEKNEKAQEIIDSVISKGSFKLSFGGKEIPFSPVMDSALCDLDKNSVSELLDDYIQNARQVIICENHNVADCIKAKFKDYINGFYVIESGIKEVKM